MAKLAEPGVGASAPAAEASEPERAQRGPGGSAGIGALGLAAFAVLSYLPLLVTARGKVEADTKAYLYLDPGRLLARASSIWDPSIAMGTLSHQQIGYLFPMGPYFWVTETFLGIPAWVAQRIWVGTLIFLAGLGVRYLMRTLGLRGWAVGVAVVAYAFTPYVLGYAGIASMLLGPWVALPWWIAMTHRALHREGWLYPALFALSVQLVGSLNGSALFFGLVGPALWALYVVIATREVAWGKVWSVAWRTGSLTVLASLWWLGPLWIEGKYGLNILRFSESVQTVSATSYPYEVLRGLGYWFLYGGDVVTNWNSAIFFYTTRVPFILASLAIPAAALLAAASMRWRYRAFFVLLILAGVAMSVGAAPYDDPSIAGGAFKSFALTSDVGFALRNTGRAVPLIALGVAVLLGAGVAAAMRRLEQRRMQLLGIGVAAAAMALVLANALPALSGHYYQHYLERSSTIPSYWQQAIDALDAKPHDTRVLALPGSDFASYRWGDTRDPIEPGLMDRPFVARELVPWGSAQTANLLQALDHRVQDLTIDPNAVAPIARLMGVGDVELRLDLQTDKWGLPPSSVLWRTFTQDRPQGLGSPTRYGAVIPGALKNPPLDQLQLPGGAEGTSPPPVAVMPVQDAVPIVRADAGPPTVVDGDGEGLVDAAGAGVVDGKHLVLYSATFETTPKLLRALPASAPLVLTDSNRRRGLRWTGLHDNFGYTEAAGEKPLATDPIDQRLDVFPSSTDRSRTVSELSGVKSVRATTYGTPGLSYAPGLRPALALDGDPRTAWAVDGGTPVRPERLEITLRHPVTTDRLNLVQYGAVPIPGVIFGRSITSVRLRFDGAHASVRPLGRASRTVAGQTVTFPRRTFRTVSIEIDRTKGAEGIVVIPKNAVGFSEVRLADQARPKATVRVGETMRVPTDLLGALGAGSARHPLAIVLSQEPTMDQRAMRRVFRVPTTRTYRVSGLAGLSVNAHDAATDHALGLADATAGGVTATASGHLADARARASAAIDDDLTTAWVTPLNDLRKRITLTLPAATTIDHLDLKVVADGRHSLPTSLTIRADDGTTRTVAVPPLPIDAGPGGVAAAPVQFAPLHGRTFTVAITGVNVVRRTHADMPVGFAELGLPGVAAAPMPAALPGTCITGLVAIDGRPFPVRVVGSTSAALRDERLSLRACGDGTVTLGAGTHTVAAAMSPHNPTGFDVSQLTFSSGAGGTPAGVAALDPSSPGGPRVQVVHQGRASMSLRVTDATRPFWLVLGQSLNAGWHATADGKALGTSTLVDGYANGWRISPAAAGKPVSVSLTWTPQQTVWKMILVSIAAVLLCLGIVAVGLLRRRRRGMALAGLPGGAPAPEVAWASPALAPNLVATGVAVLSAGALGLLLVRPWVGLLAAAVTLLAIRYPVWRTVMRLAPFVIVAGVAFDIAAVQVAHHYPGRFDWPTHFDGATIPVWIAIVLLASDAIVEVTWRRARR